MSGLRRILRDDRGQVLPISAVLLAMMVGVLGLMVDVGQVLYCSRQLQDATDAAALAGAQGLPNSTTAINNLTGYSAAAGDSNLRSNLSNVTLTYSLKCLVTLQNEGMACTSPANANAVQVTQTVNVPVYFYGFLGHRTTTLSATSTAAMRGASPSPYNVAIIVDTTASMNSYDSDSQCSTTRLGCELTGVQVLLNSLSPCGALQANCGTPVNGNVTNPVDEVALFTFPNMLLSTVLDDYACLGVNPTIAPYTFPAAGASSYAPLLDTYLVVGYRSDYRSADTATTLVSTSDIVRAVGGASGCPAIQAPGGEGTYYAGAIYAAQASLVAQKAANPGSQNVLILISDGDASASSLAMLGASATSGTYPSLVQQCSQAVTAAQAAAAAGTRVYAVAYGAEASGCSTDTSPAITPCQTMRGIASEPQYFFSDYTQSGSGSSCISASQPTSNLNQIFTQIASDLTVARLIPNNTT